MKILFTSWFKATPEVLTHKLYCLYKNLSNKHIDKLVLFVENCEFNNIFNDEKLIIIPIEKRMSYKIWMDYADKEYPEDIKILSNSDVYFDSSVSFLDQISEWEEKLYILSRKDLTKDGNIIPSGFTYNPDNKVQFPIDKMQDAWIYKKINYDFNKDWNLGVLHCENHFRENAKRAGVSAVNLFDHIDLIHVDWRQQKNYSQSPYPSEWWNNT
jgi:hypothetical protein